MMITLDEFWSFGSTRWRHFSVDISVGPVFTSFLDMLRTWSAWTLGQKGTLWHHFRQSWYHKSKLLGRVWPLRSHNLCGKNVIEIRPHMATLVQAIDIDQSKSFATTRLKFFQGIGQLTPSFAHIQLVTNATPTAWHLSQVESWPTKLNQENFQHRSTGSTRRLQAMLLQELIGRSQKTLISHLSKIWKVQRQLLEIVIPQIKDILRSMTTFKCLKNIYASSILPPIIMEVENDLTEDLSWNALERFFHMIIGGSKKNSHVLSELLELSPAPAISFTSRRSRSKLSDEQVHGFVPTHPTNTSKIKEVSIAYYSSYIYIYTIIINNSHYKIISIIFYPFLSIFRRPSHLAVNKCMAIASEALCSSILTAPPSRKWGNSRRRPSTSIGRKAPGRIAKPTWTIKQGYPHKNQGTVLFW